MKHLLFLSHRIPYPPNKGDKIRSFHVLEYLSRRFRVHLGAFVDDPADWKYQEKLAQMCESVHLLPLARGRALVRGGFELLTGGSLSVGYFRDSGMRNWVGRICRDHPIAAAYVYSSSMAPYALGLTGARRVVDYCDLDSLKWRQYAEQSSGPLRIAFRREANCLARAECDFAAQFDACLFISAREAGLFECEAARARVRVMRNGVDAAYFDPANAGPSPFPAGVRAATFVGAMDYAPNVDAVKWFCAEVLAPLRARVPDLHFYIVGSNPAEAVRDLAKLPGVIVTGRVEDVRPYVGHSACIVAPLRIARGVQNKVLEAFAMGQRVIGTAAAFEGIEPELGDFAWLAETPEDFAAHVEKLLLAPRQPATAEAARQFVLHDFQWDGNLRVLDELLATSALAA